MTVSLSAFVLFTATDLDLRQFEPAHEVFLNQHWDQEESYRDIIAGQPGGMWINTPTMADPTLAPPGEHLAIVTTMARFDIESGWERERERFTELLLDQLEATFPGYRDHVTYVENATPQALQRYTLNSGGAAYGWENTPSQTGTKRLAHQGPIPGLYLAGHWSQPGSSSLRCFSSGIHTAHIVMGDMGRGGEIPSFQDADLPSVT
jgi:phytoene dehydrogenase-like protein